MASRARDGFKTQLLKIVVDAARTGAKFACWMLERGWPLEYGAFDRRPVPQPPPSRPDLSSRIPGPDAALGIVDHLRRRFARFKSATGRTRCGELHAHLLDLRCLFFKTGSEGLYFFLLLRNRGLKVAL